MISRVLAGVIFLFCSALSYQAQGQNHAQEQSQAQGQSQGENHGLGQRRNRAAGPSSSQGPPGDPIPTRPDQLLQRPMEPFQVPYDRVQERTLANGLTLVVVEDPSVPLVDIAIALRVGSQFEDRALLAPKASIEGPSPGIMAMTATLLRAAGAGAMDAETLDVLSEFRGLEIKSFGGRHRSGVVASGSVSEFDQLSQWVADVLLRPRFDEAQVTRYRENAVRSLSSRYQTDVSVAVREWQALLFGRNHPRFRPLQRVDIEQWVPQAFARAHAQHYSPQNTVVAIAGGVSAERALARFEELFGDWSRGPEGEAGTGGDTDELADAPVSGADGAVRPAKGAAVEVAEDFASSAPGFYQLVRESPQGVLLLGHPGIMRTSWRDSNADAAALLSEILGGPGPVSRLRGRLRDRDGLVYSVQGSVGVGASEAGLVQIFWQVDPASALPALRAAMEEIHRLRERVPARKELELARGALVDSLPTLFDTAEEIAGRYAEDILLGRPHDYWQNYADRLARVTPEQVRRAAVDLLRPSDFRAAWVGPKLPTREVRKLGFEWMAILPERDPVTLQVRAGRR